MGGFCRKRDKCPHYTAFDPTPAERLCLRGQDGIRLIDSSAGAHTVVDVFRGEWIRRTHDVREEVEA